MQVFRIWLSDDLMWRIPVPELSPAVGLPQASGCFFPVYHWYKGCFVSLLFLTAPVSQSTVPHGKVFIFWLSLLCFFYIDVLGCSTWHTTAVNTLRRLIFQQWNMYMYTLCIGICIITYIGKVTAYLKVTPVKSQNLCKFMSRFGQNATFTSNSFSLVGGLPF